MSKKNRKPAPEPVTLPEDGKYVFTADEREDYDEEDEQRNKIAFALALKRSELNRLESECRQLLAAFEAAQRDTEAWFTKLLRRRGLDKHPLKEFNGDEGYALFAVPQKPEM